MTAAFHRQMLGPAIGHYWGKELGESTLLIVSFVLVGGDIPVQTENSFVPGILALDNAAAYFFV